MSNKVLGLFALLGAPFLMLGTCAEEMYTPVRDSWFTGVWGILYITPWMGSIVVLQRLQATGKRLFSRRILQVILFTLGMANLSNIMRLMAPFNQLPAWFFYIDLFWPLSNVVMLVVGITVAWAGVLKGWRRYVPLFVGCWLPFAFGMLGLFGRTPTALFLGSLYSAITWSLLALIGLRSSGKQKLQPPANLKFA